PRLEGPAGEGPAGERCQGAEAPHVDEPVGAGHRLEAGRGDGVEDGQDEARRVVEREERRQAQREGLPHGHEREGEGGQVAWWWRRRLEVADVAGVAVERRVQGQGAAVEAEDPECEAEERR